MTMMTLRESMEERRTLVAADIVENQIPQTIPTSNEMPDFPSFNFLDFFFRLKTSTVACCFFDR